MRRIVQGRWPLALRVAPLARGITDSPEPTAPSGGTEVPLPSAPTTLDVTDAPGDRGIKVLALNHGPVNVMDLVMISELTDQLSYMSRPGTDAAGVVLTSAVHNVFSAGLDLKVLNENLNEVDFLRYWHNFQQLWLTMHALPLPIVAAVNGNAPAAGCIIALACDYRVMARESSPIRPVVHDETNPPPAGGGSSGSSGSSSSGRPKKCARFTMGITAARAGFAAPGWVAANLQRVVGKRCAERLLTTGELLGADEALRVGLVDEVVEHADDALLAAVLEVERLLEVPPHCRWLIKDACRTPLIAILDTKEKRARDLAHFYEMLASPPVRESVSQYVARLGGGKKQ